MAQAGDRPVRFMTLVFSKAEEQGTGPLLSDVETRETEADKKGGDLEERAHGEEASA